MLEGQYNFVETDKAILSWWKENNFFKPEYNPVTGIVEPTESLLALPDEEVWSLVCPPPNAYDNPHIGNLSGYIYMDMLARYKRMNGKRILMLPGKDHAGLEGEAVFIKDQLTPMGKKKSDYSRDEFYSMLYAQQQKFIPNIREQEQLVGLSADFSRDLYTLDEKVVTRVLDTFVDLYSRGLIYKGTRIVNWDPAAQSTLSDSQCEREERYGKLWYVKYPLADKISLDGVILYCARHGQTTDNVNMIMSGDETSLTDLGIKQTEELAEKLKSEKFDYIISSPMKRTIHTAEIIANKLNLKIIEDGRLREANYGSWTGKKVTDFEEHFKVEGLSWNEYLNSKFSDDVENLDSIKYRLESFLRDKADDLRSKKVLIISHQQVLKSLEKILNNECSNEDINNSELYTYKITDSFDDDLNHLIVATSRPETILGDTALVINPEDERYKNLIGKKAIVPIVNREVPIITSRRVDTAFGSGVLKLTPSHSLDDYAIMSEWNEDEPKQKIGYINVIDKTASMTGPIPDKYLGKKAKAMREEIASDLDSMNLLIKVEDIKQNVLISERTGAIVEPLMGSQWYMKVSHLGEEIKGLVTSGELKLHPAEAKNRLFDWLDGLRDWSISRSLWWGYRLPVWYAGEVKEVNDENGQVVTKIKLEGKWLDLDITDKNHVQVQLEKPGESWIQDEDILDTWFSSGQWPGLQLETWGMMDRYPVDCLMSAGDLLVKWDLFMMIFSYLKYEKTPFKNLYLTGLMLASDGKKMSKSKKNGIPIEEIIQKYGTDAFRFNCIFKVAAYTNYVVTDQTLKGFRNFNNKIWNAAKFVKNFANENSLKDYSINSLIEDSSLDQTDQEMLELISNLKISFKRLMDDYKFWIISEDLYLSFWNDFCDKYLESVKNRIGEFKDSQYIKFESAEATKARLVINIIFKEYLKMLHPFIPFVTERIWQEFEKNKESGEHEALMFTRI
jgi:valyl-tRNA synthetase